MNSVQTLKEIETSLRQPESDRGYLADHLVVLATILALEKNQESGLVKGVLGGMQYAIDRLRDIWKEPDAIQPKSLAELKSIYAEVELSRFAKNKAELDESLKRYRQDCILVTTHQLKLSDGATYYVLASANDQTTVDGQKLLKGEILDAHTALTPSFQVVYRELLKNKG
jgi:hypothetical protein